MVEENMKSNLFHAAGLGKMWLVPFLLVSVLGAACNFAGLAQGKPGPGSTASQGSAGSGAAIKGSVDCQAVGDAFMDFEGVYPTLGMASNGSAVDVTTPGTMFYIDFTRLRSDYDMLATLPDDSSFGKTSDAIAQFRQLTDLVEARSKTAGTASSGSSSSQNPVTLYAKLSQPYVVVGEAFATSCPNYSAPTSTPNP